MLALACLSILVAPAPLSAQSVEAGPYTPWRGAPSDADAPRFDGWSGPKPQVDCKCRPPGGGKLPIGAEICIQRGSQMVTMRCEMSLNSPFWRQIREGCDAVS